MKILLTYATNSGSTQTASQLVVDELTRANHTVTMKHAAETVAEDMTSHDAVILASPTWDYGDKEGQPHEDMIGLLQKLTGNSYEGKPFAVLGLGDSSYTVFCGAVEHMEEFVKNTKGKLIIPSLRIDGFYYNAENTGKVQAWANNLAKALLS